MILKRGILILGILTAIFLAACSSSEEKRAKFMDQGLKHYAEEKYTESRLDFKNALQIDPKYGPAFFQLGRAELKLKNFQAAYKAFLEAEKITPADQEIQIELGRMLLSARQPAKAIEKADLVLAQDGNNIDARVIKASAMLLEQNPQEALALLEPVVTPGLKNPQAFIVMALGQIHLKQEDKARQILILGIEANPEAIPPRLMLARIEAENKRLDAAVTQMQAAIGLAPEDPGLPYQLADLYWNFQQVEEAKKIIQEQVSKQPDKEDSYLLAAAYLQQKNEAGAAEKILRTGLVKLPKSFKLRFALSDVLVTSADVDQAFTVLNENLGLTKNTEDPEIINTRLALARLHLLKRDIPSAQAEVEEVLKASPNNSEAHFINGQILLATGKAAEAITEFRVVVSEKPEDIRGYLMLSRAHLAEKQAELAMDTLKQALEVNPNAPEALRAMAVLQARNKDYAGAERNLRKILEATPEDVRTLVEIGDLFYNSGDLDRAEQEYAALIEKTKHNPAGYLRLSALHMIKKDAAAAEKVLRQGYETNPDEPTLLTALVQVLMAADKNAAAEEVSRQAINRQPEKAIGYATLGQVFAQEKKYAEAEAMFRKAITMEPGWLAPYNALARLFLSQDKQDQAIQELENLRNADPNNMTAYLSLALLYENGGNPAKAVTLYRELLAKNPDAWVALNNLAFLLSNNPSAKELDEALRLAEQANKLRPREPAVMDTLAWVQYRRGAINEALALVEDILTSNPEDPGIQYHAAVIFKESGRLEEALEQVTRALQGTRDFRERAEAEALQQSLQ
ncbi:MAG: tetratricopeptide repeat protein [bacterium]|nr:tetratricopeptide repeat protein [bacterium]